MTLTTPLLGVVCHHSLGFDIVYTCMQNFTTLLKPFWRYGWCPPKFKWFT